MCRVMEEKWEEGRKATQKANARTMLAAGKLALEEVAEYTGLPLDEVKRLAGEERSQALL